MDGVLFLQVSHSESWVGRIKTPAIMIRVASARDCRLSPVELKMINAPVVAEVVRSSVNYRRGPDHIKGNSGEPRDVLVVSECAMVPIMHYVHTDL